MKEELWFGISRNKIEWFPTIDYDKCTGCMACVNKCTHGVYAEKNGKPKVINPKSCVIGCVGCDKVCPKKAISHPPKSYLEKLAKSKEFKSGCDCDSSCGCGGSKCK